MINFVMCVLSFPIFNIPFVGKRQLIIRPLILSTNVFIVNKTSDLRGRLLDLNLLIICKQCSIAVPGEVKGRKKRGGEEEETPEEGDGVPRRRPWFSRNTIAYRHRDI